MANMAVAAMRKACGRPPQQIHATIRPSMAKTTAAAGCLCHHGPGPDRPVGEISFASTATSNITAVISGARKIQGTSAEAMDAKLFLGMEAGTAKGALGIGAQPR